jgi:membrane protein DedA with SNARE-associated domain
MGTVGSIAGALVFYALGHLFGEPRVRFLIQRFGKWMMLSEADFDRALEWFERYGERVIFFGRMVPIVRSLISIPAGIARMNLGFFCLYTAIGTAMWSFLLAFAGYLLGKSWPIVSEWVSRYEKAAIVIGIVVVVVFFARRLLQRRQSSSPVD